MPEINSNLKKLNTFLSRKNPYPLPDTNHTKMTTLENLSLLPLPVDIINNIYSLDSTHPKHRYNSVMNELQLRYNEGLWWLSCVHHAPNSHQLSYIALPKKVNFKTYSDSEDVCTQALHHELLMDEFLFYRGCDYYVKKQGWTGTIYSPDERIQLRQNNTIIVRCPLSSLFP